MEKRLVIGKRQEVDKKIVIDEVERLICSMKASQDVGRMFSVGYKNIF